jgi:hypothetical protein
LAPTAAAAAPRVRGLGASFRLLLLLAPAPLPARCQDAYWRARDRLRASGYSYFVHHGAWGLRSTSERFTGVNPPYRPPSYLKFWQTFVLRVIMPPPCQQAACARRASLFHLRARGGKSQIGGGRRHGEVLGGCIRGPRTKTSYASWFLGKPALQSS